MTSSEMERLSFEVYERILQIANDFLHKCKNSTLTFLAQQNPTYEQIARDTELLAEVVGRLADSNSPMRAQQAYEYCVLLVRIGRAIASQDEVALRAAVDELDQKPFILS